MENTVGLFNFGCSGYINAALQCLIASPGLADFFLSGAYEADLTDKDSNPMAFGGKLAKAFAAFVKKYSESKETLKNEEFITTLEEVFPSVNRGRTSDVAEFVVRLLDGLHEDLNRVLKKPYTEKPEQNDLSLIEYAALNWKTHLLRNDSYVVETFIGQLSSTLKFNSEASNSLTVEPFMALPLPIPSENPTTLMDCIELWKEVEVVDEVYSRADKKFVQAEKELNLFSCGRILIIILKRPDGTGLKKTNLIRCPLNNLDLSQFMGNEKPAIYNLYAVIDHLGSVQRGANIAKVKVGEQWKRISDDSIRDIVNEEVIDSNAYVLFYERN